MQIGYLSKHFKNECRQNAAWFDKSVYCVYEELLCLGWWTRHSGHCPQEFTVTDRHKFFFVFTLGHFPIAERERERERGRERENHRWERESSMGERDIDWLLPLRARTRHHTLPDQGLYPQPRYVPDREWNHTAFPLWDGTPTTGATLPRAWIDFGETLIPVVCVRMYMCVHVCVQTYIKLSYFLCKITLTVSLSCFIGNGSAPRLKDGSL